MGRLRCDFFLEVVTFTFSNCLPSLSHSKPHQPDSERGDADGKSEVSSGADNLGFEGQQPTSANERVNHNARLFEFYITPFTLRIHISFIH